MIKNQSMRCPETFPASRAMKGAAIILKCLVLRDEQKRVAEVYRIARVDSLGMIEVIRVMRRIYQLTLVEAKAVSYEADTGRSIFEANPAPRKALEDVLNENFDQ